jgi:hypothetical protein
MGMDYYLRTDPPRENVPSFPESLSYFFEQWGGYAECSMVGQTEKLLKIDLRIFQKTGHPEMPDHVFHEIKKLRKVVTTFIEKIQATPKFYEKVKYQPLPLYPPNIGYLERGGLLKDLQTLDGILRDLEKDGVRRIELVYA